MGRLTCWLVGVLQCLALTDLSAICPVHHHAHSNSPVCRNGYAKLQDDNTVGEWHDTCYWPISTVDDGEGLQDLDAWINGCRARMPTYLPFQDSDVAVITAYVYPPSIDDEASHNGIDYSRSDGRTFTVHSVADGVVIFVGYHPSPGNVVIIEHRPKEGPVFRSIYHHLRNGRDNDIRLAARTEAYLEASGLEDDEAADAWQKAGERGLRYIVEGKGSKAWVAQQFGSNDQVVLVREGQHVLAGEQIGWAGDTGMHSGGTHLHFMVSRVATVYNKNWLYIDGFQPHEKWMFFDPYGLYAGHLHLNCYNEDDRSRGERQHPSLFAPTHADFVGIDLHTFADSFDYFADFGYFPRALATEEVKAPGVKVTFPQLEIRPASWEFSGSFQWTKDQPVVRVLQSADEHQRDFVEWSAKGWRPKKVVGSPTAEGLTRYSSIYSRVEGDFVARHLMTPDQFDSLFSDLYQTGYVLQHVSLFSEDKTLMLAGQWEKPEVSQDYAFYHRLGRQQLLRRDEEFRGKGLQISQVIKYNHPDVGVRYAALWLKKFGLEETEYVADLPAKDFDGLNRDMKARGFVIKNIDSHEGAYAIVYTKETAPIDVRQASQPTGLTLPQLMAKEGLAEDRIIPPVRGEGLPSIRRIPKQMKAPDKGSRQTPGRMPRRPVTKRIPRPPQRASLLVEGRQLVRQARPSAGTVDVQQMGQFGPGWSTDEQLLWLQGRPGSTLSLWFNVPSQGRYQVAVTLTQAPDYGNVQFYYDGRQLGRPIKGFAEQVRNGGRITLGIINVRNSTVGMVVTITGKARRSRGFLVGIDHIELFPVD